MATALMPPKEKLIIKRANPEPKDDPMISHCQFLGITQNPFQRPTRSFYIQADDQTNDSTTCSNNSDSSQTASLSDKRLKISLKFKPRNSPHLAIKNFLLDQLIGQTNQSEEDHPTIPSLQKIGKLWEKFRSETSNSQIIKCNQITEEDFYRIVKDITQTYLSDPKTDIPVQRIRLKTNSNTKPLPILRRKKL